MNDGILSPRAENLRVASFGEAQGEVRLPMAVDGQGRLILSPSLYVQVQSNGLDIRPLDPDRDGVWMTAANLDLRGLNGARDGVRLGGRLSALNSQSGSVPILSTDYFLTTNVSAYRQNAFYVSNVSGVAVGVTVALEIAPADIDPLYVTDGSSFSLVGGQSLLLTPSRLMKFARVSVSALLALANITVYYFARA